MHWFVQHVTVSWRYTSHATRSPVNVFVHLVHEALSVTSANRSITTGTLHRAARYCYYYCHCWACKDQCDIFEKNVAGALMSHVCSCSWYSHVRSSPKHGRTAVSRCISSRNYQCMLLRQVKDFSMAM